MLTNELTAFVAAVFALLFAATAANAADLTLHLRSRAAAATKSARPTESHTTVRWKPNATAILICDMWDHHWCAGATKRVGEMAPIMNLVVKEARRQGVFIIHAPSDTMDFYKGTPQRRRAMDAPAATPPVDMSTWCALDPAKEAPLPIDAADGGCDDLPTCPQHKAWTREHPAIEIADEDAVTDNGLEVYNLLQQHGIENVIIMGVHANMCVLGRSFGIRRLVSAGKHVVLMRDMTDTMYNSRSKPFVPHFDGTDLMIHHIETYWCPTITSTDFLHRQPFHFVGETKAR
jgi:nicotinamidase-related amidase